MDRNTKMDKSRHAHTLTRAHAHTHKRAHAYAHTHTHTHTHRYMPAKLCTPTPGIKINVIQSVVSGTLLIVIGRINILSRVDLGTKRILWVLT